MALCSNDGRKMLTNKLQMYLWFWKQFSKLVFCRGVAIVEEAPIANRWKLFLTSCPQKKHDAFRYGTLPSEH